MNEISSIGKFISPQRNVSDTARLPMLEDATGIHHR